MLYSYHYDYLTNKYHKVKTINNIKCNAELLSGCRDYQTGADAYGVSTKYDYTGAFTNSILSFCQSRASFSLDNLLDASYAYLKKNYFQQVPQLTCSKKINTTAIFAKSNRLNRILKILKRYNRYIQICDYRYKTTRNKKWLNYKIRFQKRVVKFKKSLILV